MVQIPGGQFAMGDHFGVVDPQHPTDEVPIHNVTISPYYIDKFDITVQQYCDFLNSAMAQGQITIGGGAYYVSGAPRDSISVNGGLVYLKGGKDYFFLTLQAYNHSTISWDGQKFSVLDNRQNHPATSVSWFGAAAYCNWLSIKDGYQPCYNTTTWDCDFTKNGYRLPTEAEWEYAARGHTVTARYWGDSPDKACGYANVADKTAQEKIPGATFWQLHNCTDGFAYTAPVGKFKANAFGLKDMLGNVWEWTEDSFHDSYKDAPADGSAWQGNGEKRVLRGGSWNSGPARVRSAKRGRDIPATRISNVGFRLARTLP
jgi:formylglycine-generating enzyme required for sulfatase activity